MKFMPSSIPDILIIQSQMFGDDRGFFMETYRKSEFDQAGIKLSFVQDNHSRSQRGVLRGLHYQVQHAQGKLVRVVVGEVFDVAVDLRRNSATFKQWVGAHLSAENKQQVWVPPGFAHGFYVLSDWTELVYKVTDYWSPEWERTLRWDDPDIGVDWPLIDGEQPILSGKDAQGSYLRELEEADLFE